MSDRVLRVQAALSPRDHLLLQWLRDHGVLTTPQIAHALFPSLDFAQRRLQRLIAHEVVDRFRPLRHGGGSYPYHYVIDQLGAEVVAAQRDQPNPRPGYARDNRRRWTSARILPHRLGVNQFFTDLAGHARTHPDHHLLRWWPEIRSSKTGAFTRPGETISAQAFKTPIRPDGHGIWAHHHRQVPFFFEYDTGGLGGEPLTELLHKLAGYERLTIHGGPRWPILFRLHSTERETNLHNLLADTTTRMPIATAVLTTGDGTAGPAGRSWRLLGHPGLLTLAEFADVIPDLDTPTEHSD
ncbi:replication-relaxation family protein [Micromonosporaceae bacterium Da 78-11]